MKEGDTLVFGTPEGLVRLERMTEFKPVRTGPGFSGKNLTKKW